MNYAQLTTPDGSKSDFSTGEGKNPGLVSRERGISKDLSTTDIEGGLDEPPVQYIDDKPRCGGLLGRWPIVSLSFFIICGIGIGIGLSQFLICRRSETTTWCEF